MKIYVLSSVPYHDNGEVTGVFLGEGEAIESLKNSANPNDINCDDFMLQEWQTDSNELLRTWRMHGTQVTDPSKKGWHPIRVDFEYLPPEQPK